MTKHYITTTAQWNTVSGLTLSSGDLVELNNNLDFTSEPSDKITIPSGVKFDGRNHTVTLSYSSTVNGLFNLTGGTIKNLKIDGDSNTLSSDDGTLIAYDSTNDSTYGTVTNCSIINITTGTNGGCLLPRNFGSSSTESTVTRCSVSDCTIGTGGICGALADNVSFNSCYCKSVSFLSSAYVGGICESVVSSCSFTDCYCSADMGSSNSYQGGILGYSSGATSVITITRCYFIGTINSNYQGGLVGRMAQSGATLTITDCYSDVTSISATYAGGLIGLNEAETVSITNSYTTNSSNGAFIGYNTDSDTTITLTNTHTDNSDHVDTGAHTIDDTNANTTLTDITGAIGTNWSSSIWESVTSDQPILSAFTDTDVWDASYTAKDDEPEFAASTLAVKSSTSCLHGDMLVLTRRGYIPIKDIKERQDSVMTGTGIWAKVKQLAVYENYTQELYVIPQGYISYRQPFQDVILTKGHKFFLPHTGWVKPKNEIKTKFIPNDPQTLYHIKLHNNRQHEGFVVADILTETWK